MDIRSSIAEYSSSQVAEFRRPRTSLPVKQLLVLVAILLAESLTNSIIRSFTDASTSAGAIDDPGASDMPESPSLYSQFLESSLFLAKATTVYHWGRLSDRLGRRPILLLGLFGLGLSTCTLGLTNNPWLQTVARSAQGVFGGNIETAKSVIAEVTDNSNRHRAYAALPLMQSMGISIGSSIGNFLVSLDEKYPIFKSISFIKVHQLFIPCAVAATFSFLSYHLTYYFFEETLSPEFHIDWKTFWGLKDQVKAAAESVIPTASSSLLPQAQQSNYGAADVIQRVEETAVESAITDVRHGVEGYILKNPVVGQIQEGLRLKELIGPELLIALLNYSFVSFLDQSQQTLLPSMYTSPIESYGLGLSADDMTKIMMRWASYNTTAQLLLFPWLLKRYGPKRVYATCLGSMMAFFALFPVAHVTTKIFGYVNPIVWGIISVQMAICSLLYMAYGCTQIFIMDAVPDKSCLGSVNGIGQSVGSTARMIAPPLITFIHTLPMTDRWLAGYSVYLLLFCITVMGTMVSALLPRLEESMGHLRGSSDREGENIP